MRSRKILALLALGAASLGAQSACSDDDDTEGTTATTGTGTGGGGTSTVTVTGSSSTTGASSASSGGGALPWTFTVSGVVTDGTSPVEGAIVMQGGGTPSFVTGPDGAFTLELTQDIPGIPAVLATKIGYRTIGAEFYSLPDGPVELALRYVTPPDNALGYTFGAPGVGIEALDNSTDFCGHCHTTETAEFQTSAHARATKDPYLQDLYAGVSRAHADQASCVQAGGEWKSGLEPGTAGTAIDKCYLGGGVLPDLNACGAAGQKACDDPTLAAAQKPSAFGRCADCHAIALDGIAGGRNLHDAVGRPFEHGNHCDACHKVSDVDLTKPPGNAGALVMQRPRDKFTPMPDGKIMDVMYGPLPDVANEFMGGSYQPKYSTSEFCAGCHEQKQEALVPGATLDPARWPDGLPTLSTFSEWWASGYNSPGTQCQFCHMPESVGLESTLDVTDATNAGINFGFVRPAATMRQHIFRGPLMGTPRLVDGAVTVSVAGATAGSELTVTATVTNGGAGHAVPTGEPLRSLVLLVRAEGCGSPFTQTGGMTVHDVGGATAEGTVGTDVTAGGATLTWAAGAARAKAGDVVRVVRATGAFDDYPAVGFFANPALTPAQKGLAIYAPVGEATVASVGAGAVTLSAALATQPGDRVYLGDALAWPPVDGDPSLALAGSAGYSFARVMVDSTGRRGAPPYRAVDIASDNRIPPLAPATTTHVFAIPPGCASGQITATALYRPLPVGLSRERGWDAKDYVIASASKAVSLL